MKNLKKTFHLLFIILVSSTLISPMQLLGEKQQRNNSNLLDGGFSAENITIQDDAFHISTTVVHIETWYFDAKLSDNSTFVCVYCLFQIGKGGFILHGTYIYKNANIDFIERKITPLQHCEFSYETPYLNIENKHIIKGFIDNSTQEWKYTIKSASQKHSIDLLFTKTAHGWKGNHLLGWWLAIPSFQVNGTILVHNIQHQVKGTGYHDHNMYPIYVPFLVDGYHFGSFGGEKTRVTWANLIKNQTSNEVFSILSHDMNFSMIPSKDLSFTIQETIRDHGASIPKKWSITANNQNYSINLTGETIETHFIKILGVKYWRYHVAVTGSIRIGSTVEYINSNEISELLYFY